VFLQLYVSILDCRCDGMRNPFRLMARRGAVSKMGVARVEVSSKNKRERDERERESVCVCVCVCRLR